MIAPREIDRDWRFSLSFRLGIPTLPRRQQRSKMIGAAFILIHVRTGRGSSPTGPGLRSGATHRSGALRRRLLGHLEQPFQSEKPFLEELVAQIGQRQRGGRA
jgi:hypothetical protein